MKRFHITLMTTIFFLFFQPGVQAQTQEVGIMTLNKGVVKLRRNKVDKMYQNAGDKIPVHNLDEIQTGKNSTATILFEATEDKLELYSLTFFKIDQITPEASRVSMSIGKARFKVKKRPGPLKRLKKRKKRFRVRTANAIVGVKGTEFVMAAGADVTSVLTIEGTIDVASVAAPEVEVEVSENQASQIKQTSTPTAPVTVPPAVKENILNADSPNAFNSVSFGKAVPATDTKQQTRKKSSTTEEKTTGQKSSADPKSNTGTQQNASSTTGTTGASSAAALLTPDSDEPAEETTTATGESDQQAVFGAETGGEDEFAAGDTETPTDDAINLETLETAEFEDIDVEEPEIDPDDIFDPDDVIEDIEEDTEVLQEEIEDIQAEILDTQLQEIKIKITYE